MKATTTWGLLGAGVLSLAAQSAAACGCFAPPDPTVPVVQAGERILFAMKDGTVTAHIQIQYVGEAKDFGWLLPLPSVPTLELGVDEVFTTLYNSTQPKYRLTRRFEGTCGFGGSRSFGFAPSAGEATNVRTDGASDATDPDPYNPLVIQDSLGPYDYAVLKADRKDEMFQWLTDNHYFIPTGTDETVGNYIRAGAFFLALKLQSGKAAGELQPVVVRYPSQLPMIPIILTSVAAQEHMGVQVWMLGSGRAIPRNFHHAVVNDALVDWQTGGQNYNDVVIRAADEAPDKHAFVTEYAGVSSVMKNRLDRPGRFGEQTELAAMPNVIDFIEYLFFRHSWPASSQLVSILARYVPEPDDLVAQGVSPTQFYRSVRYYTQDLIGWKLNYQPEQMAAELFTAIAEPTRKASALFDENPYLTRMYTTLSPADMNKDPAFSYNLGLDEVKLTHSATLTYHCSDYTVAQNVTPAVLSTEQGWVIGYPKGTSQAAAVDLAKLPAALRYEVLPEEGAAEVTHDNEAVISAVVGGGARCGCSASPGLSALVLLALALKRRGRR